MQPKNPVTNTREFITTNNFSIIREILYCADENTLIIFDVDEVLLSAIDQSLKQRHYLYEKITNIKDPNIIRELYSIIFAQSELTPVDERFIMSIKE